MNEIFISYRREDTSDAASRLHEDLCAAFGQTRVFTDIHALEPGKDFREEIGTKLASCKVLLALIGQNWLTSTDARGNRRLDDPEDFVRLEIQAALERKSRVIPLLLNGATMPKEGDLPKSLAKFARCQAYEISARRWQYDVERLIETLNSVSGTKWKQVVAGGSGLAGAVGGGVLANSIAASIAVPATAVLAGQFVLLGGGALVVGLGVYRIVKKGLNKV